jgi:hypothetical protein
MRKGNAWSASLFRYFFVIAGCNYWQCSRGREPKRLVPRHQAPAIVEPAVAVRHVAV